VAAFVANDCAMSQAGLFQQDDFWTLIMKPWQKGHFVVKQGGMNTNNGFDFRPASCQPRSGHA